MVPFGLTNAPIVFMCLINNVFNKYLKKFVLEFLDGIRIYSQNEANHEKHNRLVVQVLREKHLYALHGKDIQARNHRSVQ